MDDEPLLTDVDAVVLHVDDLDAGLRIYRDAFGHRLLWRNDDVGQAGLATAAGGAEIVLSTRQRPEPNWLVRSVEAAAARIVAAGGRVLAGPEEIPVGRVAVAEDPFGNALVLVELSKGSYAVDGAVRPPDVT